MELIEIFKKTEGLKPAESLKKFDPVQIPVLELDAKADLEFINPTPIKRDVVMILWEGPNWYLEKHPQDYSFNS